VPFPNTFDDNTKDPFLDEKLQTEGELRGILRRGVEALPKLMARGHFEIPKSVADAKDGFVTASDAVRCWVSEQCELDLDPNTAVWTLRTDLYRAYRVSTFGDRSKPLSAREFYNRLEQINGIRPHKVVGQRGFKGIRLCSLHTTQGGP
jgi:putative DNA primase/helicase